MENFSKFITEPRENQIADTNEFIGMLLAGSVLAYCLHPFISDVRKEAGGFFSSLFGKNKDKDKDKDNDKGKDKGKNKNNDNDNDDDDDKGKNKDKDKDQGKVNKAFNSILMLAKQANEKDKNKHEKEKNGALLKMLTTFSFDKDGKELPVEERINKMKDQMTPEQFEAFKKDMTETYEKNKDNQEFKDALAKAQASIKPEDYDKMMEEAKKEAKATLEQLDKEKKELEEYDKKLKDIEDQINGTDDADKKKKLEEQQKQLQQNPPQTMAAAATGVSSRSSAPKTDDEKKEDDKEPEKKEGDKKTDPVDELGKKYRADLIDMREKQSAEKAALENEYADKIKNAKDDQEKEDLENEKKSKLAKMNEKHSKEVNDLKDKNDAELDKLVTSEIKAARGTDKDKDDDDKPTKPKEDPKEDPKEGDKDKDDDNKPSKPKEDPKEDPKEGDKDKDDDGEKVEKDEDGNILKQEEVKDPKTGKKIKVVTHTGPRGGKFYYPDGKSKTPENKVYLNEDIRQIPLSVYLARQFGQE